MKHKVPMPAKVLGTLGLIPFLLEGVALNPELNQSDGMHPNEKGTLVISDTLEKSIISFIKK